jgi:hypothetical protein
MRFEIARRDRSRPVLFQINKTLHHQIFCASASLRAKNSGKICEILRNLRETKKKLPQISQISAERVRRGDAEKYQD